MQPLLPDMMTMTSPRYYREKETVRIYERENIMSPGKRICHNCT